MDIQNILVYLIVFLCIVYAGKHFLKSIKKTSGGTTFCNSGCSGCKLAEKANCHQKKSEKK